MAESEQQQGIPTRLSCEQFQQFVLPHLTVGSRGPAPKLTSLVIFNYILRLLYLGCQWKELPIEKGQDGLLKLRRADLLDTTVIHGDGTTTSAKKGGDNIGFSGHKKVKGDKIVAFCDRNCNVIAPFVSAPGNRNESPLLREALPLVSRIALAIGLDLQGTIVSLDGVYDCRTNRKAIFNRGMVPNINANLRGRRSSKPGRKPLFNSAIFKERFNTIERVFGWEDKFRRLLLRFDRLSVLRPGFETSGCACLGGQE